MRPRPFPRRVLCAAAAMTALAACSPKRALVNVVGNALASGSGGWSRDDDPELVRNATPFALKTLESLIDASPHNVNLLSAAASGFTAYGSAFVESDADYIEATDRARATELRKEAKKLYVRGRDYGLRGLEERHEGLRAMLSKDPATALAKTKKKDIPLLYWTAAAWASAIAIDKTDASLGADLPIAAAMMQRIKVLDDTWGNGAVYDFFLSYDASRPEAAGGSLARAKQDFDRAIALAKDHPRASTYVAYAEAASVGRQDKKEFTELLDKALAIDPDADPDNRLPTLLAQKRARWLLSRTDELFIE